MMNKMFHTHEIFSLFCETETDSKWKFGRIRVVYFRSVGEGVIASNPDAQLYINYTLIPTKRITTKIQLLDNTYCIVTIYTISQLLLLQLSPHGNNPNYKSHLLYYPKNVNMMWNNPSMRAALDKVIVCREKSQWPMTFTLQSRRV